MNCIKVMLVSKIMNIKLLTLISFLLVPLAYADTVYKSHDADGNVIFSDVDSAGAEAIEIQKSQTLNLPKPDLSQFRKTTKLTPEEIKYTQFEIVSPENDSTIRSNEGKVSVNIEITPTLDEKHEIAFFMDGKQISSGKSQQLSLSEVDRGTHIVFASILNGEGKVIKRSNTPAFHLKKHSVNFINNNAPAPATSNSGVITPTVPQNPPNPAF